MNKKQSQAFENGRAKALREIDERIAAKLGGTSQQIQNAAPRTAHERLGFGCREDEVVREKTAFANAAKAASAKRDFFPPGPAEVRAMMARTKEARAELHRTAIENKAAARKRLGLGNKD